MLTDDGYRQLMKHAKRLAQEGHGELAQHLRDAIDLRAEVDALKSTLTQQGMGYRADVEKLEAEVEALRADAERWEHARSIACFTEDRDMGPGGWWTVAVHVKRRPAANTIDAAVDAARAAQGVKP